MYKMIALLTILSSLPGIAGQARVVTAQPVTPFAQKAQPQYETRVYIRRQCLLSEAVDRSKAPGPEAFVGPLAAILLPFLIEKGLGAISGALKKAGGEETLKDSGRLPTYLYQLSTDQVDKKVNGRILKEKKNKLTLNPNFVCVLVVRGTFKEPDEEPPQSLDFDPAGVFSGPDDEEKRKNRLAENGIPVSDIAAVYEAQIKLSDDETGLLYESKFLHVNTFQGSRSHDTRAMVMSIAITGAGAKEGEPLLSLVMLNLGEVRKGKTYTEDVLKKGLGRRSGWVGGLGISEDSLKAIELVKSSSPEKPTLGVMPINIEGTFGETDKGSKILQFIADMLDATKGDVSKALSGEILKDRGKQGAEAADAREKLRQDEEEAYSAYLSAEADLAALGPEPAAPTDAERTIRNVKTFERNRTKRLWCLRIKTLNTLGIDPSGQRPELPC